jgi:hypothetical protein
MTTLRGLLACVPLVAVLGPLGCAFEEGDVGTDENIGETEDALVTPSCKLSRASILASVSGGRRRVLDRAFTWYDAHVSYSQSRSYQGYRTDCSGYVSMCWETGTSYTTANFISGGGKSSLLGSYGDLEPGDALVHRSNGAGHVVLFLGWDDAAHARACVLEENSTADDMQWGTRAVSSLKANGYRAIRADKFR